MKKSILLIIIIACFQCSVYSQQNPVDVYANKIANRMKDSLDLETSQRNQLFTISKQLGEQKKAVWTQYPESDTLSIKLNLQRIENSRDSLYRPVLGEQKYSLYLQRKREMLNNN